MLTSNADNSAINRTSHILLLNSQHDKNHATNCDWPLCFSLARKTAYVDIHRLLVVISCSVIHLYHTTRRHTKGWDFHSHHRENPLSQVPRTIYQVHYIPHTVKSHNRTPPNMESGGNNFIVTKGKVKVKSLY